VNDAGNKDARDEIFHYFRMHELIPDGHILKLIDKHWIFIRAGKSEASLQRDRTSVGRPRTDGSDAARGYLFGIKSERRLCEEVGMHLGYRWFVGLKMSDTVPDHSTFSKNRHGRFAGSRYGRRYSTRCAAMHRGRACARRARDRRRDTLNADAAMSGMQPVVVGMKPGEYLAKLDEEKPEKKNDDPDGGRDDEFKKQRQGHQQRDAPLDRRPGRPHSEKRKQQRHETALSGRLPDDNASRVILDASVSGLCGRGAEMELALAGLEKIKWKYKTAPAHHRRGQGLRRRAFIRDAFEAGITPHVPVWDTRREHDSGIYPIGRFAFDEANNRFICPEGSRLTITERTASR